MKEKKEMQIVVTADDSKAKTKLQKLADYLKSNFENDKKQKVDIDTVKSEIKLAKLESKIKTLKDHLTNSKLNDVEFNSWSEELSKTRLEADKLKETLSEANAETDKMSKTSNSAGDKMSSSFEKAGKKTRKFVLSLFSIRTAWSLISRASSTYMSQNEETSNKVAAAWSYLGNILGPIIERVVGWLQYGIAYLNVFIKALSGVDFLAKSIKKTTTATNKELKKTVSSMDEIVNLDRDSGNSSSPAGALQDIANLELNSKIVDFLEDLADILKVVWGWAKKAWDFLEENFGTVGAAAIVGGLALIIGGSASGLWGIVAALSAIAAVELGIVISKLKELHDALNEEDRKQAKVIATKIALFNYYKQQYESASNEKDRADYLERMEEAYNEMASAMQDYNGSYATTVELAEQWKNYYDETATLSEQIKGATEDANSILGKMDETTVDVKMKIGADLTEAERDSTSWLSRLGRSIKNVFNNIWYDIRTMNSPLGDLFRKIGFFASGGFPEEGQLFIANEKGPEMIGNIGGSTAVVNNQQIVDSVSIGVANAVAGVLGSQKSTSQNASHIYINGHEIAKAIYPDMENEGLRRNKNASVRRA